MSSTERFPGLQALPEDGKREDRRRSNLNHLDTYLHLDQISDVGFMEALDFNVGDEKVPDTPSPSIDDLAPCPGDPPTASKAASASTADEAEGNAPQDATDRHEPPPDADAWDHTCHPNARLG